MDSSKVSGTQSITLSGLVLLSTINALESIGISTGSILSRWKIKKVGKKKQYPVEIRIALNDQVHEIYGDSALFAFGYANALKWLSLRETRWSLQEPKSGSLKALNHHMKEICRLMGDSSKVATKIYNGPYGASLINRGSGKFLYRYIQASCLRHQAYVKGHLDCLLIPLYKYWNYTVRFQKNMSKEGEKWAEFV